MSFEKMNQFVEEHTILMREFLRNISTITDDDLAIENNQLKALANNYETSRINTNNINTNQNLPIVTLTPQSPDRSRHEILSSEYNQNENDSDFEPELIDLGKQLSILHSLLVTILAGLDETKIKFTDEIMDILNEINEFKNNVDFVNLPSSIVENNEVSLLQQNKLYSYENRLHSVMKNQMNHQVSPTASPADTMESLANMNNQQRFTSQITVNMNDSNLASANINQQKVSLHITCILGI